jgi:caffeoyl-CoA O-methyltransferase
MVLSKADTVLKEIERMREKESLPIIGPHKGQVLVDVIREIKPKRILEVGTLVGYSAVLMGKELGKDGYLITIEIRAEMVKRAEENIMRAGILPTVEILVGNAKEIMPTLEETFDLVFIDAKKEEYLDYLLLVEDKIHKGSVIVADNAGVFVEKMKDYLDYVRSSGKYSSKFVPVGEDGLEISIRL